MSDPTTADDLGIQPPRWGLGDVVVAFIAAQVASLIGFTLFAASKGVPAESLAERLTIGETALLQVPLTIVFLGGPVLVTRIRGNGPLIDLGWTARWRDMPIGLAIGVACQFVLVPLVSLPVLWLTDTDIESLEAPARELTDRAQGPGVGLLILVVVVAAPLAEELFFRGFLQRALVRRWPVWPGLFVTSLVFGVSHFQPLQFPALAAFGLVLSVLAHRTGRLGRNTWAHVGFNATTVVLLLAER